jgi:hypothetical protein
LKITWSDLQRLVLESMNPGWQILPWKCGRLGCDGSQHIVYTRICLGSMMPSVDLKTARFQTINNFVHGGLTTKPKQQQNIWKINNICFLECSVQQRPIQSSEFCLLFQNNSSE